MAFLYHTVIHESSVVECRNAQRLDGVRQPTKGFHTPAFSSTKHTPRLSDGLISPSRHGTTNQDFQLEMGRLRSLGSLLTEAFWRQPRSWDSKG